jgi:hypothetical protein
MATGVVPPVSRPKLKSSTPFIPQSETMSHELIARSLGFAICTPYMATANPPNETAQSTRLSVTDEAGTFDRALSANYNETANEPAVSGMPANRDYVNRGNGPDLPNLASE